MLSGDGNENSHKTVANLISKKNNFARGTLFLYFSLPLFCTTTTSNFQKLLSYTFYGGNVVCGPVHFFFAAAHFYLGAR